MKNLWNDLAARVRAMERTGASEAPFGFTESVLRKLEMARQGGATLLDDWAAVLRPALGLACGAAILCFLLQYRVERDIQTDALVQTEELIHLAVLDD